MNAFLMLTVIGASIVLSNAVQPLGAGYNSRCVCLRLESRIIPQENLRRVEILPRGPHCKTTEVIRMSCASSGTGRGDWRRRKAKEERRNRERSSANKTKVIWVLIQHDSLTV
uniref:tRNA methyltransferase 10B n=1 Tax=Cyprinus carpio carpio TaxID=630221 RepID=A0A8C0YNQ6_CYPCA